MKKRIVTILLALMMVLSMASAAFAAKNTSWTESGMYDVSAVVGGITLTPQTANKTDVVKADSGTNEGLYAEAERIAVSYDAGTPAAGKYYMVFVLKSGDVPTVSNIVYIDQVTADAKGKVEFNIYPSELNADTEYKIYLSTNATAEQDDLIGGHFTQIGSYCYYVPYTLGDINDDNRIDAVDASLALQIAALIKTDYTQTQELAADVNRDSHIDAVDASMILQRAALIITEWP